MEKENQVDSAWERGFSLHSFGDAGAQETIQQDAPREILQQEKEHEQSLDFYDEENVEVVQQNLMMKSKSAMENMIKSNITVDLINHKIEDEKAKINVLDEKLKLLIDEREHLKSAEFIQNAKLNQLTKELENIRNIVGIFNKHSTEDADALQNKKIKLAKYEDLFEKFKSESKAVFQKCQISKDNVVKYKSMKDYKERTSAEYKERIQSLEKVLKDTQDEIKQNDEILEEKQRFFENIKIANAQLKATAEMETKNHERMVNELSALSKMTEDFRFQKNEMQIRMNAGLEEVADEIKMRGNELESLNEKEINLKQQLEEVKRQNVAAYSEIDRVKEKIKMDRSILDKENDKIKAVQKEIEEISSSHKITLANINEDTEKMKEELAQVTSEKKSIAKETEAVKISIDHLNKQLSHNKLRVELTQNNETDLTITYSKLNEDKQQLAERIQSLQAEQEALNVKYNSSMESYNHNIAQGETKQQQLKNDVAQSLDELSSKRDGFNKEMEDVKQTHAIEVHLKTNEHKDATDKLQKVYDDLKRDLQAVTEDKMHLQEELVKKTALKDSFYRKYHELQKKCDEMKMEPQKAVGILKSPSKFVVPSVPAKSVSFKPTISWNSASGNSLDSLFEEMSRDSQVAGDTSYFPPQNNQPSGSNQPSENRNTASDYAYLDELLYKRSQRGSSEEVQGSYSSSPPVRLSDSKEIDLN